MTERFLSPITDMNQSISFDPSALLTTSTINNLHFPDLTTSGISDSGGGRPTSFILDGVGMCESMTESFCSVPGQDESVLVNSTNGLQADTSLRSLEKKNTINAQKKRRSRKAQYDASVDGISFDKIEPVNIIDEQSEADDAWLFQIPNNGNRPTPTSENIFSWVHKEFKENDINATKHRLLCKLDDMSHARTIRSISCHNFAGNQRSDSVKRSSTEQQVNPEPVGNGRMISPLRSGTPLLNGNGNTRPTSPASSSPLRHTIAATSASINVRSREASREREREPLDYTDLEVIAKVQLEKLRLAERQGPLSKRFGGSSNTLISTDSRDASPSSVFGATRNTSPVSNSGYMTPRRIPLRKNSFVVTESQYSHVLPSVSPRSQSPAIRTGQWSGRVTPSALDTCMETSFISSDNPLQSLVLPNNADDTLANSASDQPAGNKPPVAPKSLTPRNGTKPNNHRRSNTQTISTNVSNSYDLPDATDTKPTPPGTNRTSVTLPNSANTTNRARPPVSRPLHSYRGSQTSYNNNPKVPATPPPTPPVSSQKNVKKPTNDLGSTFTAKQFSPNGNSLLNDVSNKPRTQIPPSPSSSIDMTPSTNGQTSIPRSSSTLSQGRKSGIPTIGKQGRPSIPTPTRTTASNTIPSSQSSDSMMTTRNVRAPASITRPQIPDTVSPTSSWNEGCY
ncbi:hypothetical protein I4U23_014077 [Adineta vaga]|nr:hypothetical protein I4U23_014077 [Adineta vaga]